MRLRRPARWAGPPRGQFNGFSADTNGEGATEHIIVEARRKFAAFPKIIAAIAENERHWRELDEEDRYLQELDEA